MTLLTWVVVCIFGALASAAAAAAAAATTATTKTATTTTAATSSTPSTSGGANIASGGEQLSRAQIEQRKALAQSMMADIRDSIARRKDEKGLNDVELASEVQLSDLLRGGAKSASGNACVDGGACVASDDDDIVVTLFARAASPLDAASFKENAEKQLRQRSNDKRVDEDFRRVASKLRATPKLHFCRVDVGSTLGQAYAEEFGAVDLPLVKLFVNGKLAKTVDGALKMNDLIKFIDQFKTPFRELSSEDDAHDAIWNMKSQALVVGFFKERGAEFKAFYAAAEPLRGDFQFLALVADKPLERIAKVPRDRQSIVVFRSFDVPAVSDAALFNDVASLTNWIDEHASNFVEHVDKMTFNVFVQRGLPLVVLWLDPNAQQLASHLTAMRRAARQFHRQLTFLFADGVANRLQAEKFGVQGDDWPALTLLDMSAFKHYVHDTNKAIDFDSIVAMCKSYLSGTLTPNIRKQIAAADALTRPVKQLVYDTFERVVFDTSKDVLVAFCHPNEPACLTLDGLLQEVAENLKRKTNFVVATIDMSQNDAPRHSIRSMIYGYPTIKFFPAKDKKALVFEEKHITAAALIHFMEDKAVNYKAPPMRRAGDTDLKQRLDDTMIPSVADFQKKVVEGIRARGGGTGNANNNNNNNNNNNGKATTSDAKRERDEL